MSEVTTKISPTKINLHQKSKLLEIGFSDGFEFIFPCEYLRVLSTAAEVKIAKLPVGGKASVSINNIEPQGNYALRLFFDDGHDTGIYSWDTLHSLGKNYEKNWKDYCEKLTEHGLERGVTVDKAGTNKTITVLYFMQLANLVGTESESLTIPNEVKTVADLLQLLSNKNINHKSEFTVEKVQVTVNKQFSEPYTPIESGDEVAIVPRPQ